MATQLFLVPKSIQELMTRWRAAMDRESAEDLYSLERQIVIQLDIELTRQHVMEPRKCPGN